MLDYWRSQGAASVYGNPVSEPYGAKSGYYSQAFEGAIFQFRPEFLWTDTPSMTLQPVGRDVLDSHTGQMRRDGKRQGGGGDRRASALRTYGADSGVANRGGLGGNSMPIRAQYYRGFQSGTRRMKATGIWVLRSASRSSSAARSFSTLKEPCSADPVRARLASRQSCESKPRRCGFTPLQSIRLGCPNFRRRCFGNQTTRIHWAIPIPPAASGSKSASASRHFGHTRVGR